MAPPSGSAHLIGLISDTHGEVRPGVHAALAGVELILHAGDVGGDEILAELRAIAPAHAVAGNTDPLGRYEPELLLTVGGVRIHVSHGHELGRPTPKKLAAAYDADVIVYGHTHQPMIMRLGNSLVVNPGAAGPARFKLKPSVGLLKIKGGRADVEIVALD